MRRFVLTTLLVPALAGAQQPTDLAPVADRVFAQYTNGTPGCAVGAAQNGTTVLTRGYGMADLETGTPITAETIFESGSVAKQFTATATLLLMNDGKLRLDDVVQKYVPELPTYDRPITIRHLLSHTSGLREWSNLVAVAGWPRGSRVHTQELLLQAVTSQKSLNYPVGDYYSYTNSGFALLETIVERVSGMPFTKFSEERIFKPLGMTHTRWRDDFTAIVPGRAQAYSRRGDGYFLNMPFENVIGPGGLLTTVGDWLTWNNALDNRTLGGWLVDSLESQATLTSGRKIQYAMGLMIRNVPQLQDEREVAHSGSTGGYSTYLMRVPAKGISVAVLCNVAGAPATTFARQMAAALNPAMRQNDAIAPSPVAPDELAHLAGIYRSNRTHEPLVVGIDAGRGGATAPATIGRVDSVLFRVGARTVAFDGVTSSRRPDAPFPRIEGDATGLRVLGADGDTVTYTLASKTVWQPSIGDLQVFTGSYRTDEIPATWTATIDAGRLTLAVRPGMRRILTPVYPDAFTAPGIGVVWFTRDAGGRVTAMHFGAARLWDLKFDRVRE